MQSGRLAVTGELAAGAIHEINNPLFAILTLTDFLLRDAEPGTVAHERLELVAGSARDIKEVVERLHRFGRERVDWGPVDLEEVARDAVALVRATAAGRQAEIRERYPDEPALVEGSAAEIRQLFLNLLANAVQAMPAGGTAAVAVTREGRSLVVSVSDEGEGISAEEPGVIFEPFYTTKDGFGTGLGLAAARAIAERHGGSLAADPSAARGARLVFALPAVEPRS